MFFDSKYIYFSDSKPNNKTNTLCFIDKNIFKENLKVKQDMYRSFLAHPNPLLSSIQLSSNTDLEIYGIYDNYIQNFVSIEDKKYISFIINGKVYTADVLDLKVLYEIQILKVIGSNLVIIKNNKTLLVDKNFKDIKTFEYDLIDIIEFENNYIVHKADETIVLMDQNFKEIDVIEPNSNFKKIYYINKRNILISYRDDLNTLIYNFLTKKTEEFDQSFIKRAIMLDENILMVKKFEKNDPRDLLKLIY
ncbi:hypothetical protein [Spiroplasma endosymbiont of Diplazon laetatorius]|uniref:hypothetical protein n=1 Tax=Spiroplasma endosymbiont of Diplazon laetatorius TaxID=3066322 RepID=UPI0030D4CF39